MSTLEHLATKHWWPNLEVEHWPLSISGQPWSTGGGSPQLEQLATKHWWPNLEMEHWPLSSSGQPWSTGGGSLQLEQLAIKHWWPSWEIAVLSVTYLFLFCHHSTGKTSHCL